VIRFPWIVVIDLAFVGDNIVHVTLADLSDDSRNQNQQCDIPHYAIIQTPFKNWQISLSGHLDDPYLGLNA
jgi:hypothetical protein